MPRPRSGIDRRIVRAARARFLAAGVDGASLRTIARDARTNVGMVVYYFPTKDDLFLAVVEEVYAAILADVEAILGAGGATPLEDRLRRTSVRLGTMTEEELEVVRLVVREALLSSARFARLLARFQRGHIALLLGALGEAATKGEIDPAIPLPVLMGTVLGMMGGPQLVRRALGAVLSGVLPSVEVTAELTARLLVGALRPPAPARAPGANATPPRTAKPRPAKR